jgi:hypothetical protein
MSSQSSFDVTPGRHRPALRVERVGAAVGGRGLSARQTADERTSVVRVVYCVEGAGQGEQVTVVDPAVLELMGQVGEHAWPVLPSGSDRRGDLNTPLDDPDGRQPGRGRAGLLPGSLPARRRAPLREPPRSLDGDRTCAPSARSHGQPPRRLHGALLRRWGYTGFIGGCCARQWSRAAPRRLALACPLVASAHAQMVRRTVPHAVTPMRHDGSTEAGS